jgi:uncharacterized protein (DUF1330 family)
MKRSIPALTLAFIGGVAVGIAANPTQPLRAAGSAPIYTVYEANVTDPAGYKNEFLKVVVPKLERHGVKYLARGGMAKSIIGDSSKNRIVISQNKTMDEASAAADSVKDDIKNIATKYADNIRWYIVEGVE